MVSPPRVAGDHEASSWFAHVYPRFKEKQKGKKRLGEELGMIEFIQRPGEIVFIPSGWWHIVLNLDFTIAVTQNFCSRSNIEVIHLVSNRSVSG
jgi:histone arginine demethylase JMJD6